MDSEAKQRKSDRMPEAANGQAPVVESTRHITGTLTNRDYVIPHPDGDIVVSGETRDGVRVVALQVPAKLGPVRVRKRKTLASQPPIV